MENTCRGKDCWFYLLIKELSGNKEPLEFKNCPFYQELIFTPNPIGEKVESAKVVKDCTNKRSLLILLEEVYPRLLGVQQSNEEMRNSTDHGANILKDFIGVLETVREQKSIPMRIVNKENQTSLF
jgi:hypothetical protein